MLLEVRNLSVHYYTAQVLNEASFSVDSGELVAMVGPNGAGKTTLLRAIAGLTRWEREINRGRRAIFSNIVTTGEVYFQGERIDHLPAYKIARSGLIVCPERAKPFIELSVLDNLKAGALFVDKKEIDRKLEMVFELFPILRDRRRQVSGTLSGGERVMMALGRSLMTDPKLMLIDEPSTGLAPKAKQDLYAKIEEIRNLGVNMVIVEQDIGFVFNISSRNYVMSKGKIIAEGQADELLADERIRKVYLGL
ncbi:MAG: ABC transporter ATP-binding protein [Syntrophobacteraceae bacterium]|jgi:branched-chain amino acid transport system ATP-binding protein